MKSTDRLLCVCLKESFNFLRFERRKCNQRSPMVLPPPHWWPVPAPHWWPVPASHWWSVPGGVLPGGGPLMGLKPWRWSFRSGTLHVGLHMSYSFALVSALAIVNNKCDS